MKDQLFALNRQKVEVHFHLGKDCTSVVRGRFFVVKMNDYVDCQVMGDFGSIFFTINEVLSINPISKCIRLK